MNRQNRSKNRFSKNGSKNRFNKNGSKIMKRNKNKRKIKAIKQPKHKVNKLKHNKGNPKLTKMIKKHSLQYNKRYKNSNR